MIIQDLQADLAAHDSLTLEFGVVIKHGGMLMSGCEESDFGEEPHGHEHRGRQRGNSPDYAQP